MATGTALNTATKALLEVCSQRGVPAHELLVTAKIDPLLLERPNARIPVDKKAVIWDEARRCLGGHNLGLLAAQVVPFGGYGVLDFLLFASSTLRDILNRTSRFYRLINSNVEFRLEMSKNFVAAELHDKQRSTQESLCFSPEFSFAMLLLRLSLAYGKQLEPETVYFTSLAPSDTSLHFTLFQSPIRFGQTVNRLVFRKELLNAPFPQSDAALAETLDDYAQRLLKNLPLDDDLAEKVREVLLLNLSNGNVSLEATAKTLAMSSRDLQRKLNGQGTSYRKLLDALRYELASYYVAQQVDVAEIAHRLGYTEPSAFYRAFKRWASRAA